MLDLVKIAHRLIDAEIVSDECTFSETTSDWWGDVLKRVIDAGGLEAAEAAIDALTDREEG